MRSLSIACTLFVVSLSARAGQVIVVGPGAGQVAEIQAAVDAALDGDVILVESGTYQSFVVDDKELSIVADVGQTVNVQGAIRARGLTADRTLVIAGLHAFGHVSGNTVEADGFYAKNCSGFVRVQDCVLHATNAGLCLPAATRHGAEIEGCSAVSFVRCTLTGSFGGAGGQGLAATNSSVALHDCQLQGGNGAIYGTCGYDGGNAGDGAVPTSSFLYGSNTGFAGGDGGDGHPWAGCGGDGGDGLLVTGTSQAHLLNDSLAGGSAGTACSLSCCNGYPGVPINTCCGGILDSLPGTARKLSGASLARETTTWAFTVNGLPGDFVALRIGRRASFAFDPAQGGVLLTDSPVPARYLIVGTLPSNGHLTSSIPMPSVPAGDPGRTFVLQAVHTDVNGQRWLGSPLSLVVLDSAY